VVRGTPAKSVRALDCAARCVARCSDLPPKLPPRWSRCPRISSDGLGAMPINERQGQGRKLLLTDPVAFTPQHQQPRPVTQRRRGIRGTSK